MNQSSVNVSRNAKGKLNAFRGQFLAHEGSRKDAVILANFYPLDRAEDKLWKEGRDNDFGLEERKTISGAGRPSE